MVWLMNLAIHQIHSSVICQKRLWIGYRSAGHLKDIAQSNLPDKDGLEVGGVEYLTTYFKNIVEVF